jgi:hypothetical protein
MMRLVVGTYQTAPQAKLPSTETTNLDVGFTNYCTTTRQEYFYMCHKTNRGINLPLKGREWKNYKYDSAVVYDIKFSFNFNIEEII